MHPDPAFRPQDDSLAALLVREIGFAAIFSGTPDGPRVAHVPAGDDSGGDRQQAARRTRHWFPTGVVSVAVVRGA